jgi:coiled-coil-helix-coiled-coil-helix domain-containing protein 2
MFAQMAATAGSVAVGSTIGHGISSMLFGGGNAAAPEAQAPPVQQQANQQTPCGSEADGICPRVKYLFIV